MKLLCPAHLPHPTPQPNHLQSPPPLQLGSNFFGGQNLDLHIFIVTGKIFKKNILLCCSTILTQSLIVCNLEFRFEPRWCAEPLMESDVMRRKPRSHCTSSPVFLAKTKTRRRPRRTRTQTPHPPDLGSIPKKDIVYFLVLPFGNQLC